MPGGQGEPADRLRVVLRHALPIPIDHAQGRLGADMALPGCGVQPEGDLLVILGEKPRRLIKPGDGGLGVGIA